MKLEEVNKRYGLKNDGSLVDSLMMIGQPVQLRYYINDLFHRLGGGKERVHSARAFICVNMPDKKLKKDKASKAGHNSKGAATLSAEIMRAKFAPVAEKVIEDNELQGSQHNSDDASFKLHISINDFSSMEQTAFEELNQFLFDKMVQEERNYNFHYKIAHVMDHERFADNDQFTVYFDKYSSLYDVIDIANGVQSILNKHGCTNQGFGPKDIIKVNSFVSGRFALNKVNQRYGEHAFFDAEIDKFLSRYGQPPELDKLKNFNLHAFELVFSEVLIDPRFYNLPSEGLPDELSSIIQEKLDSIVENPQLYYERHLSLIYSDDTEEVANFYLNLREVNQLVDELTLLAKDFEATNNKQAASDINGFSSSIKAAQAELMSGKIDFKTFIDKTSTAIQDMEKSPLMQTRQFRNNFYKFLNVMASILSLGIVNLVYGKFDVVESSQKWATDKIEQMSKQVENMSANHNSDGALAKEVETVADDNTESFKAAKAQYQQVTNSDAEDPGSAPKMG